MRGIVSPIIKLVIFLVITSFFTYVLGATISNASYGSTYTYKAVFSDVQGLTSGDDVRVAGVRVGTVNGIKIINHNSAQVTFTVAKSRPLPKSTQIFVRYRNLVGQRYLDIQQGAGDPNDILPKGGTIPLAQTHNALDLTALFASFQPLFQGLDAGTINNLSDDIIQALQGQGDTLVDLFTHLGDLSSALADKDQIIGDVVDNLSSFLTSVAQRDSELDSLLAQLKTFVGGLAQDRTTIGNAIDGINGLATTTADLLTQARAPLARDIVDLNALSVNLNANQATLQRVLDLLPPTTAVLTRTGSYGSWFNFYLCSIQIDLTLPNHQQVPVPVHQPANVARCNP